ncbi:MAG: septum formation initiator family protein [Oscillospiraceae bacterium]|nr:septum formation initiator family protein [Oscillospiraceae bacterium]
MKVIEGKKKRSKGKIILRIAIVAFLLYAVITFITQQVQIGQKESELTQLQQSLSVQNLKNAELKEALDAGLTKSNEYIERMARKNLDYSKPGERIFVNISGD